MKLTAELRAWLIENCGTEKDADDDTFRKSAADAMFVTAEGEKGHLSQAKLAELTADKAAEGASKLTDVLAGIVKGQEAINSRLDGMSPGTGDEDAIKAAKEAADKKAIDAEAAKVAAEKATKDAAEAKAAKEAEEDKKYDKDVASGIGSKLYVGGETANELVASHKAKVDMKWAHKQYEDTKSSAVFPEYMGGAKSPIGGQRIMDGGVTGSRALDHPSDLDKAVAGAYSKYRIHSQLGAKCPTAMRMTAHDEQLMSYALHDMKWGGVIGGICSGDPRTIAVDNRKLTDWDRKALLDETGGSEGLELAPIAFDDAIILYAFLSGELFPLVNTVPITRGRRIEGAVLAELTLQSGHAEGTAMNLFGTNGFVTAFDTTIFAVSGGFEIGLDFITDTPINIGSVIISEYGKALLKWLDTQVATGDGTTEPEGVMNGTGITSVAFGGVTPTVDAYEATLFTVEKRFKDAATASRTVFCSNELSYSRARGIAVGGGDARRVFGMDHENYQMFSRGYKITESLANTELFFGNMARYRMYRRQGMTFRVETAGETLARKNTMLILLRARFGGQIEDAAAFAISTTLLS